MLKHEKGLNGTPLWADDPREGDGPYRTIVAPVIMKNKKRRGTGTVSVPARPPGPQLL